MSEQLKRMRYATGLFMTEDEFNLEQEYHIRMRRLHNRHLHTPGIVWGLDLTANPGTYEVVIHPGMALDVYEDQDFSGQLSREIVVPYEFTYDMYSEHYPAGSEVYIWLEYAEEEADSNPDAGGENIHWLESFSIGHSPGKPENEQRAVILGKVIFDGEGKVTSVEVEENGNPLRLYAGFTGKSLKTDRLILSDDSISESFPFLEARLVVPEGTPQLDVISQRTYISGSVETEGHLNIHQNLTVDGDIYIAADQHIRAMENGITQSKLTYSPGDERWNTVSDGATEQLAYVSEVISVIPFGSMSDFTGKTCPDAWVFASGRTIGNAASGATERAHEDTWNLFNLYWNDYMDTELPVQDNQGTAIPRSTYANASLAFNANCRMTLPDFRGRAAVGRDDMGGTAANRITSVGSGIGGVTMLAAGGAQTHVLSTAQMPPHSHYPQITGGSHSHSISDPGHSHYVRTIIHPTTGPYDAGFDDVRVSGYVANIGGYIDHRGTGISVNTSSSHSHSITINNSGSGAAHNNVQPSVIVNKVIKL